MIYLDNAATRKPDKECVQAAEKYLFNEFYNPSGMYRGGYDVQLELKKVRNNILNLIADENNFSLEFTSCGTEADNHALFCGGRRGNIVTTLGEHSAVYEPCNELKQRGIEVRFAKLKQDGSVDIDNLLSLVDDKTSLVSVIQVNNETGAVNDICEIAHEVKKKNTYTLFHSDGVQAFGKIKFRLSKDIDLYSVSAHKIGGIKGVGALIKRKSLQLKPYIFGGGQESGMRSGTENVFGIKCFELAALKSYKLLDENYQAVSKHNNLMRGLLDDSLFSVISAGYASPYILCVAANGVRGETILHEADDNGLIIGTGSACSSNSKKRYSRVILACGIDESTADGVLRLSFSPDNTTDEIRAAAEILNRVVKNRKEVMK